jgi:hypothetical protein
MSPVRRPSESGIHRAVTGPPPEPAAVAAPPEPGIDAALLERWRWTLGATARKAVAARAKAAAADAAWTRLVADARAAGIPALMVVAAAADAGVEVPAGE